MKIPLSLSVFLFSISHILLAIYYIDIVNKSKHSTDMCIFTVKSIVKYYTRQNSPMYTCFLDASKVFDRINHWTLFRKLIDCHVALLIVRILIFWYQMQLVCIKWGTAVSQYFRISYGV